MRNYINKTLLFSVLQLNMDIYVDGFTMEHIPKSLSNGKIESAPKGFSVWVSGERLIMRIMLNKHFFNFRDWRMRTIRSLLSLVPMSTRMRMTRPVISTLRCRMERLAESTGS